MKEVDINFCMFLFLRFLIFPHMGQSLQSVMEEEDELLSEKVVLQLACRIVSVFQTIFLIFVKNCDSPPSLDKRFFLLAARCAAVYPFERVCSR